MRFSVDAHAIGCHLTGNEVYIRNLLKQFARIDPDSEFIAYVSKPGALEQLPARIETRRVSQNPYKRLGLDIPRWVRKDHPDLLHVQYTGPVVTSAPVVASVHDVSFLEHPGYFPFLRSAQLRLTVSQTIRRAARILTGSEFSRDSIAGAYQLDPDRIAVVHNAAADGFHPVRRDAAALRIRERFDSVDLQALDEFRGERT